MEKKLPRRRREDEAESSGNLSAQTWTDSQSAERSSESSGLCWSTHPVGLYRVIKWISSRSLNLSQAPWKKKKHIRLPSVTQFCLNSRIDSAGGSGWQSSRQVRRCIKRVVWRLRSFGSGAINERGTGRIHAHAHVPCDAILRLRVHCASQYTCCGDLHFLEGF